MVGSDGTDRNYRNGLATKGFTTCLEVLTGLRRPCRGIEVHVVVVVSSRGRDVDSPAVGDYFDNTVQCEGQGASKRQVTDAGYAPSPNGDDHLVKPTDNIVDSTAVSVVKDLNGENS